MGKKKKEEKKMNRSRIGYTVKEFAEMMGVGESVVRFWIWSKRIPVIKISRRVFIPGFFAERVWEGRWKGRDDFMRMQK